MAPRRTALAQRRKTVGLTQEGLADALTVERSTIVRWEMGATEPRPAIRRKLADALQVSIDDLARLIAAAPGSAGLETGHTNRYKGHEIRLTGIDDVRRRDFIKQLGSAAGVLAAPPAFADWERMDNAFHHPDRIDKAVIEDLAAINQGLWATYRAVRDKRTVLGGAISHLGQLVQTLQTARGSEARKALGMLVSDLSQLGGEIFFDAGHTTDAARCYAVAVDAAADASAYDLWACALVRHAFLPIYNGDYRRSVPMLETADAIASKGNPNLTTRHWVSMVKAGAYAGLGAKRQSMDALTSAQQVSGHAVDDGTNGTWLRFDADRLGEERGACLIKLGVFHEAEPVLTAALQNHPSASRRRAMILSDLALGAAMQGDTARACTLADDVLEISEHGSAGFLAKKLTSVSHALHPHRHVPRVKDLAYRLQTLTTE